MFKRGLFFVFLALMALAGFFAGFDFLEGSTANIIYEDPRSKNIKENLPPKSGANLFDPASLTWTQANPAPWPKRDSQAVFIFNDKLWLTGGLDADEAKVNGLPDYSRAKYYNDIWSSEDGLNWKREKEHANYPPIRSSSIFYFKDSLFMAGGWSARDAYRNGIWQSQDGVNWKKVISRPQYEEREGQKVLEFDGKMWLIGGVNYDKQKTFNDVWFSEDGLNWKLATSSAPWRSRWDHDIAAHKDKLWLMGGMNFNGVSYADVWSSSDGRNWELVQDNALWGKRQGLGAATFKDLMWVVSGLNAATNQGAGDAWYSSDGSAWQKTNIDGSWLGREDHAVVVFKNKIWTLGGMDSDWHWNNDVWHSDFSQK